MIGIVGGVGPYAGLDLAKKILDQTIAKTDQDHLPVIMISESEKIGDRTEFLINKIHKNPGYAIANVIKKLGEMGVQVVGIPCNTAHSPEIFNVILHELERHNIKIKLLNMISETACFIKDHHPEVRRIGQLSTLGTYQTNIYSEFFKKFGLEILYPSKKDQEKIHSAIYDPAFGIKSKSNPVSQKARKIFLRQIHLFEKNGLEAVVMGCTEIPLAIPEHKIRNCLLIDPTLILARSLIKLYAPRKLKPI